MHEHSSITGATEARVETKRAFKAFRYKAKITWSSARRGLLSAADKPNIVVGSPPEFKGEPDIWAPEELLGGSVNTCMMLTFLALGQARGLTPAGYESEAEGLLENVEGKYLITEVTVRPHIAIKAEAELERTREIMETASAQCFISNSVKSRVNLILEFVVGRSPN
jgi:organic hydroperoxide reductase OsmC/OhrA